MNELILNVFLIFVKYLDCKTLFLSLILSMQIGNFLK